MQKLTPLSLAPFVTDIKRIMDAHGCRYTLMAQESLISGAPKTVALEEPVAFVVQFPVDAGFRALEALSQDLRDLLGQRPSIRSSSALPTDLLDASVRLQAVVNELKKENRWVEAKPMLKLLHVEPNIAPIMEVLRRHGCAMLVVPLVLKYEDDLDPFRAFNVNSAVALALRPRFPRTAMDMAKVQQELEAVTGMRCPVMAQLPLSLEVLSFAKLATPASVDAEADASERAQQREAAAQYVKSCDAEATPEALVAQGMHALWAHLQRANLLTEPSLAVRLHVALPGDNVISWTISPAGLANPSSDTQPL